MLFFMEICPKRVFVLVWYLPVQIKVRNGKIRTKHNTSEIEKPENILHPLWQCKNLVESSNDDSSVDEEGNGTTCKICKILCIELTKKCGDWFPGDICDEYKCPKCYDKREISVDDDFFVVLASDHKY